MNNRTFPTSFCLRVDKHKRLIAGTELRLLNGPTRLRHSPRADPAPTQAKGHRLLPDPDEDGDRPVFKQAWRLHLTEIAARFAIASPTIVGSRLSGTPVRAMSTTTSTHHDLNGSFRILS